MKQPVDHMKYMEGMEVISSEVMDRVIADREAYDPSYYTAAHVQSAWGGNIAPKRISRHCFLLRRNRFWRKWPKKQKRKQLKHFGSSIYLFTPLYISNYCENYCVYCGFNCHNRISRAKLEMTDVERELKAIAATGLEEILILTGKVEKSPMWPISGKRANLPNSILKMWELRFTP